MKKECVCWSNVFCECPPQKIDQVNHPQHYGGENNVYEAIKVIDAWGLDNDFYLGNAVKYLSRAGKKDDTVQDLKKAIWYIEKKIEKLEK
jgi:hypothetical protein